MYKLHPKLKPIFQPYLLIQIGTILLYTFLNWLLIIKLKLFSIEENYDGVIIPLIITWLPILIWLRPRLKLLKFNNTGKRNPLGGILYASWISISVPLIIAQFYMYTASGKLTQLNFVSEIYKYPPTKYYTIKHYYINKNMLHVRTVFAVTGKYHDNFNMRIYAAVPVFDKLFPDTSMVATIRDKVNSKAIIMINEKRSTMHVLKLLPADSIMTIRYVNPSLVMPKYGDTGKYGALLVLTKGYKLKKKLPVQKIYPTGWLAINYNKTISNNLSETEKRLQFALFTKKCDADFKNKNLNDFKYLERISSESEFKEYEAAILSPGDVGYAPAVFLPVYDAFENRNGNKLLWLVISVFTGSAVFLFIISFFELRPLELM